MVLKDLSIPKQLSGEKLGLNVGLLEFKWKNRFSVTVGSILSMKHFISHRLFYLSIFYHYFLISTNRFWLRH